MLREARGEQTNPRPGPGAGPAAVVHGEPRERRTATPGCSRLGRDCAASRTRQQRREIRLGDVPGAASRSQACRRARGSRDDAACTHPKSTTLANMRKGVGGTASSGAPPSAVAPMLAVATSLPDRSYLDSAGPARFEKIRAQEAMGRERHLRAGPQREPPNPPAAFAAPRSFRPQPTSRLGPGAACVPRGRREGSTAVTGLRRRSSRIGAYEEARVRGCSRWWRGDVTVWPARIALVRG
jgi:hypothetical protein